MLIASTFQNLTRIVIAIQLVKVGYELPKQYQKQRAVEMTICLLPVMTIMWLCTTGCIMLVVPKISWVSLSPSRRKTGVVLTFLGIRTHNRLMRHMHRPRPLSSHCQRPLCRKLRPSSPARIHLLRSRRQRRLRLPLFVICGCTVAV